MPISTIATTDARERGRGALAGGFSLLEILVVVALIGSLAAMIAPSLIRDNSARDREEAAESIARLLTLASDYAMFRGQLMAVRLTSDTLEPLLFDIEEYKFEAPQEAAFAPLELGDGLLLEWTLDEQTDAAEPALASAIETLQKSEITEFGEQQDAPPQIYLFPSGETTPVTLRLIHDELSGESLVRLDTIGRATLPDLEEEGDDASL